MTLKWLRIEIILRPLRLIRTCGIISATITASQKFQPFMAPNIGTAAFDGIPRALVSRPVK
jgi:hypothetical protein